MNEVRLAVVEHPEARGPNLGERNEHADNRTTRDRYQAARRAERELGMATQARGELRKLASGWEGRVRIDGKRVGFTLTTIAFCDEAGARARCTAMAEIAKRLAKAGHAGETEKLLEMGARARVGKPWDAVVAAVDLLCGGCTRADGVVRPTLAEVGKQWRSGELHRLHKNHVKKKKARSVQRDEEVARLYVDPLLGHLDPADIELTECDLMMAGIPEGRSASTCRIAGQYLRRLLAMCVYPLKLRTTNPVPKGWLPSIDNAKAKECLYPDEDRTLLSFTPVPVLRRLAYGFLNREGMRTDELSCLEWRDVDLERGRVSLDENKTDDPRDWDLGVAVVRALSAWKARYCPDAEPGERVFAERGVPLNVDKLAEQLRRDLKRAGVTREKLFERSANRQPIRAHDLRATFVTIALATGKTETWVADRTGHKSSTMINRYRRKARGWNVGTLDDLDGVIPELAPIATPQHRPVASTSRRAGKRPDRSNAEESAIPRQATGSGEAFKTAALDHSATPPSTGHLTVSTRS